MNQETCALLASQEIARSRRAIFGVPDSTLTELIAEFEKNPLHQVAANEGSAIAMAIGFWLQTKIPAHVYLQNSGLLNAGNPLLSLAHSSVYDIPITLTIGWRGAPSGGTEKLDEPQHLETGKISEEMLRLLGFTVSSVSNAQEYVDTISKIHSNVQSRHAILVPRGIFDSRALHREVSTPKLTRRQAIEEIHSQLRSSHAFVSGTGYMSRDLSVAHKNLGTATNSIFYLVGGMGHVSSVAAGIALGGRAGRVAAIEGDGGAMMHLGAVATLTAGSVSTVDLFIIHNGVHASVGGQSIINPKFNFEIFARSCNFSNIESVNTFDQLRNRLSGIATASSEQSSTFTLVNVQEPSGEGPSSRPQGFKELARGFKE